MILRVLKRQRYLQIDQDRPHLGDTYINLRHKIQNRQTVC